jgi:hypothetical protein
VEGRCPVGGDRRGGAAIQAPRPIRARIATGFCAFLGAVGLAAYPAIQDIHLQWLAIVLGSFALFFLLIGLAARSGAALEWGFALLGSEFGVLFAAEGSTLDELTPAYAGAFVLVAELSFWSIERRVAAWSEGSMLELRLVYLALACVGAAAVAAVVMVVATVSSGGGVGLEAGGVAAAIAALVLLSVLVRRALPEVDSRA